ncbi:MAG: hypothetical protein HQL31_12495, partial [Planctomycetes bacterium]|nr:hypothetical protein [Planctomycetota bacterium]
MQVKSITRVSDLDYLATNKEPEHIHVTVNNDGRVQALRWAWMSEATYLYTRVKKRGGVWNRDAGGWTFPAAPENAKEFYEYIAKKHPDWPIIGDPSKPFMPLSGMEFSRIVMGTGFEACLVPYPLHYFCSLGDLGDLLPNISAFVVADKKNTEALLLIGSVAGIDAVVAVLSGRGATCDDSLSKKWSFDVSQQPLHVRVTRWAVQIEGSLDNLHHYLVAPDDGAWGGVIHTTRKDWPALKAEIEEAALQWEGDNPEGEMTVPSPFETSKVHGWHSPAPNGFLLHEYQKEGAQFCASRGMRALIGDEMGVGKTAQAIAAAEAVDAPRILIVCPANARYVWEREIKEWGAGGEIQHIRSQVDKLDSASRWHIVTYDLIAARSETWRLRYEQEEKAFVDAYPELASKIESSGKEKYPRKISLDKPLDKVPAFADSKRCDAWKKMMRRLRGELIEQFLAAGQMLVVLDEAHRVKNRDAKRTQAIRRIAAGEVQLLMLTGTPLRNHEHEAAALLGLLDATASEVLSREKGYTIQDIKDCLGYFMIRRTKADVLPDLPPKTRQRIDIFHLYIRLNDITNKLPRF